MLKRPNATKNYIRTPSKVHSPQGQIILHSELRDSSDIFRTENRKNKIIFTKAASACLHGWIKSRTEIFSKSLGVKNI